MKLSIKNIWPAIFTMGLAACTAASSVTPNYYFQDRVDGGNAGLTPGCHVEYLTDACSSNQVLGVKGDSCDGQYSVNEWTNDDTCHEHDPAAHQDDQVQHNCDTLCGTQSGSYCDVVENACVYGSLTVNSANCICADDSKAAERKPPAK